MPPQDVNETLGSRRKLIILDLDETLIYGTPVELSRGSDFRADPFYVYKRPYVDDFLAGCFRLFDTAIWTSASPSYARMIVDQLVPDPSRLAFIWASDRCTRRLNPETYEYYWRKHLVKLRPLRHTFGWSRNDILVVDDSPEKWEQSYGNLIQVTPYVGATDDEELTRLLTYLTHIADSPNFRIIDKRGWRRQVISEF